MRHALSATPARWPCRAWGRRLPALVAFVLFAALATGVRAQTPDYNVGTGTASDIVIILEKQRVKLESLDIAVEGTRREEQPRRFTAIVFHVTARGEGADELKVRRAVGLSIEKYCSVVASLAPDIPVTYDVAIA